jgi:hypothetical protein
VKVNFLCIRVEYKVFMFFFLFNISFSGRSGSVHKTFRTIASVSRLAIKEMHPGHQESPLTAFYIKEFSLPIELELSKDIHIYLYAYKYIYVCV